VVRAAEPPTQTAITVRSKAAGASVSVEAELLRPIIRGRHILPYGLQSSEERMIVAFLDDDPAIPLTEAQLAQRYPQTYAYLGAHRAALAARANISADRWFYPTPLRTLRVTPPSSLLGQNISFEPSFSPMPQDGGIPLSSVTVVTFPGEDPQARLYYLAVLNSELMHYYMLKFSLQLSSGSLHYSPTYLEGFPVVPWRPASLLGAGQQRMARLARRLVTLREQLNALGETPGGTTGKPAAASLERATENARRQIDELVYDLYEITNAERREVREYIRLRSRRATAPPLRRAA